MKPTKKNFSQKKVILTALFISLIATTISAQGNLIFNTGFEPGVYLSETENSTDPAEDLTNRFDLFGVDNSFRRKNDFLGIESEGDIISINGVYSGGTTSQRFAKLIADPENSQNKVLEVQIKEGDINPTDLRGRVQLSMAFGQSNPMDEFSFSIKKYFGESFENLKKVEQTVTFLTIFEIFDKFYNNNGTKFSSRVKWNLYKPEEGEADHLYHRIVSEDLKYNEQHWVRRSFIPLPIKEWVTFEFYVKKGVGSEGRFYAAMVYEDGSRDVVIDINDTTESTRIQKNPGFSYVDVAKLYCSKSTINSVTEQGVPLSALSDDLIIWRGNCTEKVASLGVVKLDANCKNQTAVTIRGQKQSLKNVRYQWQYYSTRLNKWRNIDGETSENTQLNQISEGGKYRRLAYYPECDRWVFSNVITTTLTSVRLNAPTIEGEESLCNTTNGSFDVGIITLSALNNLKNTALLYQWQHRHLSGKWKDIWGATHKNYDPWDQLSRTREYRLGIRTAIYDPFVYSNTISKSIVTNITESGTLSSNSSPSNVAFTIVGTVPQGGSGGNIEYLWQYFSSRRNKWTSVADSNLENLEGNRADGGILRYRRLARRGVCDWFISEEINIAALAESASSDNNKLLGINNQVTKLKIVLFPNPAGDFVNIYSPDEIDVKKLHIYDISGRAIESHEINYKLIRNNTFSIRTSHLETGIYTVQLDLVDGTFEMLRLTVKHD